MEIVKKLLNFFTAILTIIFIQLGCLLLEWIAFSIGGFWGWAVFSISFNGFLLHLAGMFDG
jgi:hypothetical protein